MVKKAEDVEEKLVIEEITIESKILKGKAFKTTIFKGSHIQINPIQGGPDRLIVKKDDVTEAEEMLAKAKKLL